MGYILIDPKVLKSKGLQYFETIPDGRAIADMSMLKMLGSVEVQIVSSTEELREIIKEQKAAQKELHKVQKAELKEGGKK